MSSFPDRLQFDTQGQGKKTLLSNSNNTKILAKKPLKSLYNPSGKTHKEMTNNEIVEKFRNYDGIGSFDFKDIDPKKEKRWYRILKLIDNKYQFRAGGFIIENNTDDKYLVFKNPALNFTFSMQYDEIVLFRSKGKNAGVFEPDCQSFINKYFSTKNKNLRNKMFIAFSVREKSGKLFSAKNIQGLLNKLPNDRFKPRSSRTITGAISSGRFKTKGYFLNRTNETLLDEIEKDFGEIDDCNLLSEKVVRRVVLELLERGNE